MIFVCSLSTGACFAGDGATDDVIGFMLRRVLPSEGDAACFSWQLAADGGAETFTIEADSQHVHVEGSSYVAIATGINWYLQHYAGIDISWNAPTAQLPRPLPPCTRERHEASVPWRYYLNFCTHSYTMAFWDWARWQQEIDWMALHGVNMPLAITGMECVWDELLRHSYGYATTADVSRFVCGSAYYGWFFMNNLTAWGGPQPPRWYEQRRELARKIFARMSAFGMTPVVPGYVGMVPHDFLSQASASSVGEWESADIVDGGQWCGYTRPAFVADTARLAEIAGGYYAAFQRLYGDVCKTHFYAIDPFHEGGVPAGVVSPEASIRAMWEALKRYDADAVWVAQHWQDNPRPMFTHTIPHGRLIILDLHGDNNGDTVCSGHATTSDGRPHQWVWGQVSNFGGNVGLFGRMDRLIDCFYAARNGSSANNLVGIGAIPEGIENNGVLYDLLFALPWTNTDYTRESWLRDYVHMRYGLSPATDSTAYNHLLHAWQLLARGIYNCPRDVQQGTTESIFMMRPSLQPSTVSSWADSDWYWDFADIRTALGEMLAAAPQLLHSDNFRYDLVDVARQALADRGKEVLDAICARRRGGQPSDSLELLFLSLILEQDSLTATRRELRLGRWLMMARRLAASPSEAALYERNARMLITTWGARRQSEQGGLRDYSNREWQGLLSGLYYQRWRTFFENGCQQQDWFESHDWPFANGQPPLSSFAEEPVGDEVERAAKIYSIVSCEGAEH